MSAGEIASRVKALDTLFEQALDATLATHGLRRRHWVVLEVLHERPRTRAEIAEAMLAFWVAAAVTQTDVVDDLVRRDWAQTDGDLYTVTADGAEAQARIAAAVAVLRARTVDGVHPAEVVAMLETLERMTANLRAVIPRRRP
ncbi:MAG: MarR family winged helix-turn-helix transcriptional regulator [Sporichthyaceae bacterium]